ncbi:alpha/beta hydrolase [Arcticibacterium luteifluviistationis]|uniref:BD-FAE-like domain-containing protein n=1 Tax=Arcticibacterium luteifluviistationis TaxID=1784714 RepID=A0A2Z4G9Q5_9BACT|nr:alpha/beta hydrolase [Arcticibacterium luteifluviistationis]AWV97941.1 hypothetical protein DJ013_07065 [Arcticibacterium luteifluviistationis]
MKNITFKGFFKKTGIGLVLLFMLLALWLVYFFVKNEAPILNGDVIYSQLYKENLDLDIYTPTKRVYEKSPVVLYIHGGAWIGGLKESINNNRFNAAINQLREKGYTVISPNYSVAINGKGAFPDCIIDINQAIKWTAENADSLKLDLDNFGIFGESAGAHIAMMNAFPTKLSFDSTFYSIKFNYVVDVYGPNDLKGIYRSKLADSLGNIVATLPEYFRDDFDIAKRIFGFDPKADSIKADSVMRLYSPYRYLTKHSPPILMIHGDADQVVPITQSLSLKKLLDSLKVENEIHVLEKVNHGFIDAQQAQMDSTQTWIVDFILSKYKAVEK